MISCPQTFYDKGSNVKGHEFSEDPHPNLQPQDPKVMVHTNKSVHGGTWSVMAQRQFYAPPPAQQAHINHNCDNDWLRKPQDYHQDYQNWSTQQAWWDDCPWDAQELEAFYATASEEMHNTKYLQQDNLARPQHNQQTYHTTLFKCTIFNQQDTLSSLPFSNPTLHRPSDGSATRWFTLLRKPFCQMLNSV